MNLSTYSLSIRVPTIFRNGCNLCNTFLSSAFEKRFNSVSKRAATSNTSLTLSSTVKTSKSTTIDPLPLSSASSGYHHRGGYFSSCPIFRYQSVLVKDQQWSDFSTVVSSSNNDMSSSEPYRPPGWELLQSQPRPEERIRGALVGVVVSDKMQKTVNVAVDRFKFNYKYNKRIRFTRKFMAHDEEELCNVGDLVKIVPDRRRSRHKHFRVHEIIRAKGML